MKILHNKRPTTQTTISDDIMFDGILVRLPVKSLIRFRTVCKDWCNLISTPKFVKTHLRVFSYSSPCFLTMHDHNYWCDFFTFKHDEDNNLKDLVQLNSFWTRDWNDMKYEIVGCCNGLVCLNVTYKRGYATEPSSPLSFFVVWNPATHERRKIISPPTENNHQFIILRWSDFGYTLTQDDYKIVAIISENDSSIPDHVNNNNNNNNTIQFWTFSLSEGKWRQIIDDFPFHPCNFYISSRVCIGDSLYWSVRKSENLNHDTTTSTYTTHIVSYNLVDENFEEIPLTVLPDAGTCIQLYAIKGCLSFHCIYHPNDVWMRKEDGKWGKLFSFPTRIINHRGFTWDSKCLVEHWGKLVLVDPNYDSIDDYVKAAYYQGIDFNGWSHETFQHVESLISPFGTSAENNSDNCVTNIQQSTTT